MGILRIISGKYRGRKISFPDIIGLRPTPDMVRETVFNWLNPYIVNAKCLDLFCGSGALSFEAISRGAELVVAMECHKTIWRALNDNAKLLQLDNFFPVFGFVPQQLNLVPVQYKYDIVLLDPPFRKNLLLDTILKLENRDLFATNAILYIEAESDFDIQNMLNRLNGNNDSFKWELLRNKVSGQVQYSILQRF